MDIVLIRHGIAEERSEFLGGKDELRPLTMEGHEVTKKIAENMKHILPKPTHILNSGLVRAAQTAQKFHEVFEKANTGLMGSLRPTSNSEELLNDIKKFKNSDVLFLVGHEPDMGKHASYLLSGKAESFCAFKKAGILWLELNLEIGRGNLRCYLPPAVSKNVHR